MSGSSQGKGGKKVKSKVKSRGSPRVAHAREVHLNILDRLDSFSARNTTTI